MRAYENQGNPMGEGAKMGKQLKLHCEKCGWDWTSRTEKKSASCPKCKSYSYEEKKKI
jgi:predicted Zn-ribbon and HTH transcriptional regulator